jgi:hypothetical protein
MIELITYAAALYVLTLLTWLFYVAIMHLRIVRHSLHPFAKFNAYVLLAIGLPLDALTNITMGSILFLEPPRLVGGRYIVNEGEWLLTARLARHKRGSCWRKKLATWLCEHLLDPFDEGHCD